MRAEDADAAAADVVNSVLAPAPILVTAAPAPKLSVAEPGPEAANCCCFVSAASAAEEDAAVAVTAAAAFASDALDAEADGELCLLKSCTNAHERTENQTT